LILGFVLVKPAIPICPHNPDLAIRVLVNPFGLGGRPSIAVGGDNGAGGLGQAFHKIGTSFGELDGGVILHCWRPFWFGGFPFPFLHAYYSTCRSICQHLFFIFQKKFFTTVSHN